MSQPKIIAKTGLIISAVTSVLMSMKSVTVGWKHCRDIGLIPITTAVSHLVTDNSVIKKRLEIELLEIALLDKS